MGKLKREYRELANRKQFNRFLDGDGALVNRETVAQMFDYDWYARKLTFDTHFRGHVLMQATAYRSTRDHQWRPNMPPCLQPVARQWRSASRDWLKPTRTAL